MIAQHRVFGRRQLGEVRPDDAVEQVVLHRAQRFFPRVDRQRGLEVLIKYPIGQHRQPGDVIEVRMRQEYVTNRVEIRQLQVANTGARVDQHIVVDEHCGGPRACADTATAT